MSDLERQLRAFVREGDVPVPQVPDLAERVVAALRRHRRRRTAGLAAAACLAAGLGTAGAVLLGDRDATAPDPASARGCAGVNARAAGVQTAASADWARLLVVTLDGPTEGSCTVGPGTEVELDAGRHRATSTIPADIAPVVLGTGQRALVQLVWGSWCESAVPAVRVRLPDGATTGVDLPADTDLPSCDGTTRLRLVRIDPADVQSGR